MDLLILIGIKTKTNQKLLSEGKAIKFSDFKECVKASDFEKLKVEIKIGVELKRFLKCKM